MGPVTETIEERAAREALELDADGWRRAEAVVRGGDRAARDGWNVTSARALLAYRDKVAAGLDEGRRRTLLWVAGFEHGVQWMSGEALSLGLIVDAGYLTPFGREVARILEAPGEAE